VRSGAALHLTLFAVQLAFASGALAGKFAFAAGVEPTALAFMRAAAAACAFVAFERATRTKQPAALPALPMIGLAILGVVVNQAFFLHGLKRGTATSAALLAATIPVFTAAIGMLARVERPRLATWLGLSLATAGVLGLTGVRDISVGNLLVTINSLSYAAYLVLAGRYIREHGALRIIGVVFVWGALILALPGLPQLIAHAPHWSMRAWALIAWFVVVPTIFAYLANAWALGRATPGLVAAYVYLQPLLVMVFARRMLGEKLDARTITAGAAILTGVFVIAYFRQPGALATGREHHASK